MLPSPHRLPTPEIKRAMRFGRRVSSPELQLVYRWRELNFATTKRTSEIHFARFAIIVPMNINKRAVVRNRIKRLMRESLRRLLPEIPRDTDGVIIVRKKIETRKEAEYVLVRACRELLDSSKTSRSKNSKL